MKLSESRSDTSIISNLYKSINGNSRRLSTSGSLLHRIPIDLEIPFMKISDEYNIEKTIAEGKGTIKNKTIFKLSAFSNSGCYAKVFLAHHRKTNSTIVLKSIHMELTSQKEFIKEFHYSYQLSHHPNILSCYQVKFQTNDYYVFAQVTLPDFSVHSFL